MNMIPLERAEIGPEGRVLLSDERAEHIRRVLHAVPGQRLRGGVVEGPRVELEVLRVEAGAVTLCVRGERPPPPVPRLDLLLALPRPKVLKRLWAPLASLGVGRILLVNAHKVERMYFDTHVLAPEFRRARMVEGLAQAGDTRLPVVSVHPRFRALVGEELDALCPGTFRVVADPEGAAPLGAVLRSARPARALLAIGPEGGWTPYERELLAAREFASATLGSRILRTDTACIAALALAAAELPVPPDA